MFVHFLRYFHGMSFTLLHPAFLWFLPLAALPVLFHLFFRMKKRPRPFSSLMFFSRIDPRLSARRRLMEYLILLLRTLLILFVLLALVRPVWFGAGKHGSVSMVIILDNSGSMTALGPDRQPKLKAAIEAAQTLLSGLKPEDTAAIVLTVDDPGAALPAGLVSDRGLLKNALGHLRETEATGTPGRALVRALALLENSAATRFEIHVLSDLQEDEWNKPPAELKLSRAGTTLLIYRFATAPLRESNVALMGARLPEKKILAGRRFPLRVDLFNDGPGEASVRLNWADDSGNKNLQEVSLPRNTDKTMNMLVEPQPPGLRWLDVWIEGDGFAADNRAGLAFFCGDRKPVWLVGKPDDFGLLPVALSPSSNGKLSGLVPTNMAPTLLAAALETQAPALVAATWETWHQLSGGVDRALHSFVEKGGNLLLTPAVTSSGPSARASDWLGAEAGPVVAQPAGALLLAFPKAAGVFGDLRDEKGNVTLRTVKAFQFRPLKLSPKTEPLLGLEDGRAVLAQTKLGNGAVFLSGLAFDSKWSTLPLKSAFLALAQNMALSGVEGADTMASVTAGERFLAVPGSGSTIEIRSVAGGSMDWKGELANSPAFPRSGVAVIFRGTNAVHVSVRASDKEGHQRFIGGDKVPALGSLTHTVRDFTGVESVKSIVRKMQAALDLFLPFLVLALLCLAAEGWLANAPPRKPRATGATLLNPPARWLWLRQLLRLAQPEAE